MKVPVLGYHPWFLCSKWKGDDNQISSQKTSEMSLPGSLGKVTRIVPDKEVFFIVVVWFCHATYHLTHSKGEVACCVTKKQRSWLQKNYVSIFLSVLWGVNTIMICKHSTCTYESSASLICSSASEKLTACSAVETEERGTLNGLSHKTELVPWIWLWNDWLACDVNLYRQV